MGKKKRQKRPKKEKIKIGKRAKREKMWGNEKSGEKNIEIRDEKKEIETENKVEAQKN